MELNLDFDRLGLALTDTQAHFPVNKAHETLHPIQDGFNL
jgi:hypothetical protein